MKNNANDNNIIENNESIVHDINSENKEYNFKIQQNFNRAEALEINISKIAYIEKNEKIKLNGNTL